MKKFLLLYKTTAFTYYKRKKITSSSKATQLLSSEGVRLRNAHDEHNMTHAYVKNTLKELSVPYKEYFRDSRIPFHKYDIILTVGGDGTFLKAATCIKKQLIIGINSALSYSVGRLCAADINNFRKILKSLINGKAKFENLHRLSLQVGPRAKKIDVLNDILIAHSNPAVLSRYALTVKGRQEKQRSSGLWISTPVGSSGAIHSAGGKILNPYNKNIQYMPRELYEGLNDKYFLTGGILTSRESIKVVSLMPKGKIYIDGGHFALDFPYGSEIKVSLSKNSVRTIRL